MVPAILLGIIACYVGGYGWLLLRVDSLSLTLSQLDIPSLVNYLILFTTHMVAFIAGFIAASYFDAVQHH